MDTTRERPSVPPCAPFWSSRQEEQSLALECSGAGGPAPMAPQRTLPRQGSQSLPGQLVVASCRTGFPPGAPFLCASSQVPDGVYRFSFFLISSWCSDGSSSVSSWSANSSPPPCSPSLSRTLLHRRKAEFGRFQRLRHEFQRPVMQLHRCEAKVTGMPQFARHVQQCGLIHSLGMPKPEREPQLRAFLSPGSWLELLQSRVPRPACAVRFLPRPLRPPG